MSENIASESSKEYSVTEISEALTLLVNKNFRAIKIRGEISGFRGVHSSGHAYFALKENDMIIEAAIWRNVYNSLKFKPQEGLEVIAYGNLSIFGRASKYNFHITRLEPAGLGSLMAMFKKLRAKLEAEGLFERQHKKPLPFMPKIIGVITSPTGAVIRDILHRIADRCSSHVILYPCAVQGPKCATEVAGAIKFFNDLPFGDKLRPDILIIARGGGSIEDLWGFNEEEVVRAAFASSIPIISAIGHETDYSLLDLVADKRAPTPTAAAEMVVPVKQELHFNLLQLSNRLNKAIARNYQQNRNNYLALIRAAPTLSQLFVNYWHIHDSKAQKLQHNYEKLLSHKKYSCQNLNQRLNFNLLVRIIQMKKQQWQSYSRLLQNVSFHSILQRGFALILDQGKQPVTSVKQLQDQQKLQLRLSDGQVQAVVKLS